MKIQLIIFIVLMAAMPVLAQESAVREGNKLYREGKFDEAIAAYDKAIEKDPANLTASYNRANALAKKGDKAAAGQDYAKLIDKSANLVSEPSRKEQSASAIRERAWYDKGVLHQQEQQLDESILAWKEALKLDPEDKIARENLQKALREKKEQEKKQQDQQQQQQKQPRQEQKQQPPPQSKLTQKQVEQLLKAMEQKEKEVQKKLQQRSGGPNKPDKDW